VNSHDRELRRSVKDAFAALRKAINAYRLRPEYAAIYRTDWQHNVSGNNWYLHKQLLLQFASWLEFSRPLETLLLEAAMRAEQQKYQEQYRSYHTSLDGALRFFGLDHTATEEDVKRQYRQLVKQYHPDTGGDETKFKALQQAHDILKSQLKTSSHVAYQH
jgi:DnaJ-domain-containing protein 1